MKPLIGILIIIQVLGCTSPRNRYLVPDGYAGWLCISYDISSAHHLPVEDGFRLVVFPPSGVVETSSPGLPGEEYRDQYFYYKGNKRRVLDVSTELGGGFTEARVQRPEHFTAKFWVSRNTRADFTVYVDDKPYECGPFKDYPS